MKGDSLPPTDHIARLCSGAYIDEDDGWPAPTAFMRKPPAEEFVSVNWLEILASKNKAEQISKVREIWLSKLKVNSSAKIALLNVGETISLVTANIPNFELPILHEPTIKARVVIDDSHSGIYNLPLPSEDLAAAELVARSVKEVLPFK